MELVLEAVRKTFGGVVAVDDVSAVVPQDRVTALIGPNGAGKTTLFNAITGFDPPDQGSITFAGQRVDGLAPWRVAELGLIRTFQTPVGFTTLTVRESLLTAATPHVVETPLRALGLGRAGRDRERSAEVRAEEITAELGLGDFLDVRTDELSAGDRKLLEFARTLMAEPKMLLLDEPAAAVAPANIGRLSQLIRRLCDERGLGSLIIDHNLSFLMQIADFVHVLDRGALLASGPPSEIAADPDVMRVYLGEEQDADSGAPPKPGGPDTAEQEAETGGPGIDEGAG